MSVAWPDGVEFVLGPDELNEPFACWTEGPFGITGWGDRVYALSPVNGSAADQWVWAGPSIDDLRPLNPMSGLTTNCHELRGYVYDADWWPVNLWIDQDGTWHSFMHAEDYHRCDNGEPGWGADLRTIAQWTSHDQGATWTYQGIVVSIDRRFALPCSRQPDWPRNGGTGDHEFVVDPIGGYLYLLYTVFTYDPYRGEDVDNAHGHLALARATIGSRGRPGAWRKWHAGDFSEPGNGGRETWVMSPTHGNPDNSQRAVTWNTHLGGYLMAFVSRTSEVRIAFSHDLVYWTPSRHLYADPNGVNYVNLIGTGGGGTDQTSGDCLWFYYTRRDYEVHRRLLSLARNTATAPDHPHPHSDRWTTMSAARLNTDPVHHWSPMADDPAGMRGQSGIRTATLEPGREYARVWRAPCSGSIRVGCEVSSGGESVEMRVCHNRVALWPSDGDGAWRRIGDADQLSARVDVGAGDRIFFVLRAAHAPAQLCWKPEVTFTPFT